MKTVDCEKLELNKILSAAADYAVSEGGKTLLLQAEPSTDINEVRRRIKLTAECSRLLYFYGIVKPESFGAVTEKIMRAAKGSALSCGELLDCAALLRSTRELFTAINKINDAELPLTKSLASKLYFSENLEKEITEKIISCEDVADTASDRLFAIRAKIKNLNERIRAKLSEYVTGKDSEYLQDGIVTIRNDRYVIPVKAEHKSHVRGFVHDRSKTGATFFIEPEYVLELNNELIALSLDEREEIEIILRSLSKKIGEQSEELLEDYSILCEFDSLFARAEFCYIFKCSEPRINDKGYVNIIKGRHPLISTNQVVPVSIELGSEFDFMLLSGANTGGKTVTMKMTGLFCLMAACGFFIPAAEGSCVSVFDRIFCALGDSQSIEEELSTFSSHITALINICDNVTDKSLVLIDEPGGGTNPEEGQAIAKAILNHLLSRGAKGIVTTHFTTLKEFAYSVNKIENASMEFDCATLKPLYRIKSGLPGASNALAVCRRLGMSEKLLTDAENNLSEGAKNFEKVMRRAEESRIEAEEKLLEINRLELELREKLQKVNIHTEELNREREKLNRSARSESRRIIAERTEQAEEMLAEIEKIFKKETLSESDLIAARTIKNKLKDIPYDEEPDKRTVNDYVPATRDNLVTGKKVYIKKIDATGLVLNYSRQKDEAEIQCGSIKMRLKSGELLIIAENNYPEKPKQKIKLIKSLPKEVPVLEINVLGLTVTEALYEVDNFIDKAVTDNLEEIKVIHGVGTGKLKNAIAEHLKKHKNVESFRSGKYGEGETGVTFIKLK